MDDLGTILSLNNWPGHLSYVLIAISYWLTDMFWLRLVAVVGLSLEILYFWLSGGDLRTGIGWDLIFIIINLYQLYRLVKDRLSLRLPEADRELLCERSVDGPDGLLAEVRPIARTEEEPQSDKRYNNRDLDGSQNVLDACDTLDAEDIQYREEEN